MEKLKIREHQANSYVKESLMYFDYPEDLEVSTYIDDNKKVSYQASYLRIRNGVSEKCIMPISRDNFLVLLSVGMSLKGYTMGNINIRIRENEVYYEAYVDIVSKEDNLKRKRRRK